MTSNEQWLICGQPRGRALRESDFERHSAALLPLPPDQARVRVEVLRFDPSMKGQMENIPRTLLRLFSGKNFGKQLLRL